ncbi:MAG TPA: permease-like cell division protein FtsX [Kofleriaceae bacterium]|jgi:cell division protein FtsX
MREALRPTFGGAMDALLRRATRMLAEQKRLTAWTLALASCAMFVVALALTAVRHIDQWTQHSGSGSSMVVYLGESVDEAKATALVAQLRTLPGVDHAELVPPAESAKRLQQALGADTALLDGVELGSLPASVEVTLAPGVRDIVAISPTVRALRDSPGVDDLVLDDGGDEKTAAALSTVRAAVWVVSLLLAALSIVMTFGALRVRLDRGDKEARVLDLLGASPSFSVVPSAIAGAMLGLAAAFLAAVALAVTLGAYGDSMVAALRASLGAIELSPLDGLMLVGFLGMGALLGAFAGAWAALAGGSIRASR